MARRAAALVRVSTEMQDTDSQRGAIEAWAAREGAEVTWYEEEAVSGAARARPVLDRLMADARRGRYDVLVVAALDRIARDVVRLVVTLDELHAAGVELVSLREGLDFRGPMGRAMASLLGAIAEIERASIRDRVRAGIRAAQARGVHCGRPRLEPTPAEVAECQRLRAAGATLASIAAEVTFADSAGRYRSPSVPYLSRLLRDAASQSPPPSRASEASI